MSTRKEHIYDLKRLLTKGGITDESRLNNNHLGFLLDQRRAKEIRDSFKRNPVIEPIWVQDYGVFELTPVNRSEDSSITGCTCKLSKAIIPSIISIVDPISNTSDLGTYMVRSTCGRYKYEQISVDKLHLIHPDSIMSKMSFYARVGNALYVTPEAKKLRGLFIQDSPLEGYIIDNTWVLSGNLVVGTSYTVSAGKVTHNSIIYQLGQSFTAVAKTYTGTGKIQHTNLKRRMTNDDTYPMSHTMAEVVKMKILTQDFGFEERVVEDMKNDSQDDANKR